MTRSLIPNSTQIPDVILDEWMPHLSGAELTIVLTVARKTFGWGKSYDRIGIAQMMECTGLKRRAVQLACDSLEAAGILAIRVSGDGVTPNAYKLNMDAPDTVLATLTTRTEAAEALHAKALGRTPEGEAGGAKNAPGVNNAPVQKKQAGGAKNAPGGAQKMHPPRNTRQETEDKTPVSHKNEIPPPGGAECVIRDKPDRPRARGKPTPCPIPSRGEVQAFFDHKGQSDMVAGFYFMEEQRGWTQGKQQLPLVKWEAAAERYILDPEGIRKQMAGRNDTNGSHSTGKNGRPPEHADAKLLSGWDRQKAEDRARIEARSAEGRPAAGD